MDFYQNQHPVTDDQFFRFHGSDRRVYRRLVFNLRRDSTESSRVMAFWLWLEQTVKIHKRLSLIPCVILSLADKDLSFLADEAVAVLHCVEMDASHPPPPPVELPMTRRVVWKGQPVNLRFFYDNRLAVVRGIAEKSNSVCLRAFGDIMQRAVERRANEVTSQMMQASSSAAASAAAAPPTPSPTPVLLVNNRTPIVTPVMAYYYTGHAGASSSNSSFDNNNNIRTITNTGYGDSSASTDYHYDITPTTTNTNTATTAATTNNALTTRVDKNLNNNNKKNKNNNNNMHSNINYKYFYTIGPSVSAERASRERRGEAARAVWAPAIPAAAAAVAVVPVGGSGGGGGARAKEEVEEMMEIMKGLEIGLGGDDDEEGDRGILGYTKNRVNIQSINSVIGAGSERSKYNDYESFGFVNFDEPEEEVVSEDARTIFLTFSKGYPITETEVRDYFTSKYGAGLIEAIHMQEVRPNEQPLYARLVVRSLEIMNLFLRGHSRHKFSIAGKHVWARKYVRKAMANDASTSA